jgi:hypothetical protein
MYTQHMEIPITQFRRELFTVINKALDGNDVWVSHKGRRLKLVPDGEPVSHLSRITSMEIVNSGGPDSGDDALMAETMLRWEQDWNRIFGPASGVKSAPGRDGITP